MTPAVPPESNTDPVNFACNNPLIVSPVEPDTKDNQLCDDQANSYEQNSQDDPNEWEIDKLLYISSEK